MTKPEPTDADREKATVVVAHLPISLGDYRTRDLDAARDVIAEALAAARKEGFGAGAIEGMRLGRESTTGSES